VKGTGRFNTAALNAGRRLLTGHASLRSVWFVNSARGAVALAAAVGVADLTNVQHGFWVVLGALSVLRTNAASTGATALRALLGTSVGFFIGAALILGIGTHTAVLWVAFPVAVLIAAYAPGTAPFAVGQAAFTVMISVLYNIIVPVGWKVGEIRVEDVAIGAGVSALAGVLFWPRGANSVVRDDLADALHRGGVYLVQATAWALGVRAARPDAGAPAVQAGARLDDALRASLVEQGTKRVPKEQVWRLVAGATRVRLTAQSIAGPARPDDEQGPAAPALVQEAVRLAGVCDFLASQLGHLPSTVAQELAGLPGGGGPEEGPVPRGYDLWVRQHLDHVSRDLTGLVGPTEALAELAKRPWWR
ncbi:MAG TPA: FUSC family protein, partial [Acidimicrobiales bacterium]|nr:FUSC family protein [Acidimicrobiales bacterium]